MRKKWQSAVYAFFEPDIRIEYEVKGAARRKCHIFSCAGGHCSTRIKRYLDTKDAQSTSNMRKHVVKCWGREVLAAAEKEDDMSERRHMVNDYLRTGKITMFFKRRAEGQTVTYSVIQHTRPEIRYVTHSVSLYSLPHRLPQPRVCSLVCRERPSICYREGSASFKSPQDWPARISHPFTYHY
jgi:hypothetical protein